MKGEVAGRLERAVARGDGGEGRGLVREGRRARRHELLLQERREGRRPRRAEQLA